MLPPCQSNHPNQLHRARVQPDGKRHQFANSPIPYQRLDGKNDVTISGGTLNANSLNLNVGGHFWTNNGAFTPGTVPSLSTEPLIKTSQAGIPQRLTTSVMNNVAGLTLSGSVNTTVNGALTLTNGVITTGSNKMIISSTGSVARTSGHISAICEKCGNWRRHRPYVRNRRCRPCKLHARDADICIGFRCRKPDVARAVSGDHPAIGSATSIGPKAPTAIGR
ncbi:MAG: hypothetical protein IPM81_22865 [Saprospirales bacterium]|nr:hypothetical protein [Saprospirales bacterium]